MNIILRPLTIAIFVYVGIYANSLAMYVFCGNSFSSDISIENNLKEIFKQVVGISNKEDVDLSNKVRSPPLPLAYEGTFKKDPIPSELDTSGDVEAEMETQLISNNPIYFYSFDGHIIDRINQAVGEFSSPGPRPVEGISGQAYAFSEFSQYIRLPVERLNLKQGTVSLWFFLDYYDINSSYLFVHREPSKRMLGLGICRMEIYIKDRHLFVGMGDNHELMENITPLDLKTWYCVSLTWETNQCTLYLDGKLLQTREYQNLIRLGTIHIGSPGPLDRHNRRTIGIIDELKIWNRPLGSAELIKEFKSLYGTNNVSHVQMP